MSTWPPPPDDPARPPLPPSAPPPPPSWASPPPGQWSVPPGYGTPSGGPGAPPLNQICLTSMILGIAAAGSSFCCALFALPLAIGAVVTGIIGLTQVRPGGGQQGRGQAIAGIACGVASVVLQIGLLLFQFGAFTFSGWQS